MQTCIKKQKGIRQCASSFFALVNVDTLCVLCYNSGEAKRNFGGTKYENVVDFG